MLPGDISVARFGREQNGDTDLTVISTGRCNSRGVGEARRLAERDALRKKSKKFLAVFVRQCPFVSFHSRCSCPPRAALAPKGKSRWGLAKATVKIDKNGHERKPTEKSKTGRRMLDQPESSRSAPGSLVPIPSNERMQSAVLHSPIEITLTIVGASSSGR
jgi:hypothetical protein